ncbi:sulfide/dihydroorotate dehydrogenase-like FAD/NAD-binding protein [Sedimentisphaera salicampi]|uniref:Dihydroorotate oxidase B, electron transfer subunit n=1 Tax=Sedimentisphaera salicampi TaxID=1941349 RepID=A0A1W6LKT1_9BACT|nr:sulfide/dihydroorotate dehydrogenase-like FAD/NAD-binding protein [Sedimentisphaera salicampi]ARN56334.1 Dihydroorotate oxidase B, electron transfer subunit [Sedimentisphaera salicampi]OXU15616.1 Dihydroorotate oxidase B, electron transfer subunit [Sedimentisphaera salicampi]
MAHRIVDKEKLSENVYRMEIEAKYVAEAREPGQFVLIAYDNDRSERIPLTIADVDLDKGTITVIFQAVGKSTIEFASLNVGDSFDAVAGPLGNPTDIEKYGKVVCVGGGIGNAPLYPIVKALKQAGNEVISILGARNKELLILEEQFKEISDEIITVTDDGSYGRKALVTEPLGELCSKGEIDLCVAIGPAIMMKFCCQTTKKYDIPTIVSLNSIMVDGTGMCGGCRVEVGGETKFTCVDGPEFDGHKVDFDQLIKRLGSYKKYEQQAAAEHNCKLEGKL